MAIQALNEDMDDGLSKVYQLTQAELEPKDDRLDYSLVSNTQHHPSEVNIDATLS